MVGKYIIKVLPEGELPKKKMRKTSKVTGVLQELHEQLKPGQIAQFDPKLAGVNPDSLRAQLRVSVKQGYFKHGTKILSRGKEWFFKRGSTTA